MYKKNIQIKILLHLHLGFPCFLLILVVISHGSSNLRKLRTDDKSLVKPLSKCIRFTTCWLLSASPVEYCTQGGGTYWQKVLLNAHNDLCLLWSFWCVLMQIFWTNQMKSKLDGVSTNWLEIGCFVPVCSP